MDRTHAMNVQAGRQFGYKQVLTLAFLVIMFYVGIATLPDVSLNVTAFREEQGISIFSAETKDRIDEKYRDLLAFRGFFLKNKGAYINLNGFMAKAMGQRYMNERVKLNNGHLTTISDELKDTVPAAEQMVKLYNKQKENGKHFLFIMAPFQISKYEDLLPKGYTDTSNQNADNLVNLLRRNSVPVLDLRDELFNDGISHEDAFFATDHHWKPEIGFWAYAKIIEYLEQAEIMEPINPMYTDLNYFRTDVFKDWFLGSGGKRTGSIYAGVDDFSVIVPEFETEISLKKPSDTLDNYGSFEDAALAWGANVRNFFYGNPYEIFGYGDHDMVEYRNERAPSNLKILSMGDSFTNVPFSFLSLVASACDEFDMRYYHGDFAEDYSKSNPDIVIVLVNAEMLTQKNTTYDFFPDE